MRQHRPARYEDRANARLIAAAPDLLAALEGTLRTLARLDPGTFDHQHEAVMTIAAATQRARTP